MQRMQARLPRWVRTSTPRAREIVLEVLKSSYPAALPSQDIYQRALKEYSEDKVPIPPPLPSPRLGVTIKSSKKRAKQEWKPPPEPPHPDHPIRSLKYLKSVLLADLAQRNEIKKVHSVRDPTPEELARKNERPSKARMKNRSAGGPPLAPVVFNVKGMIDQWGWALKTPGELETEKEERLRIRKATEGQKMLNTKKYEKAKRNRFEEEWGHLNVRRKRARVGKLEREEEWARVLDRGRQEGRAEAERATV